MGCVRRTGCLELYLVSTGRARVGRCSIDAHVASKSTSQCRSDVYAIVCTDRVTHDIVSLTCPNLCHTHMRAYRSTNGEPHRGAVVHTDCLPFNLHPDLHPHVCPIGVPLVEAIRTSVYLTFSIVHPHVCPDGGTHRVSYRCTIDDATDPCANVHPNASSHDHVTYDGPNVSFQHQTSDVSSLPCHCPIASVLVVCL